MHTRCCSFLLLTGLLIPCVAAQTPTVLWEVPIGAPVQLHATDRGVLLTGVTGDTLDLAGTPVPAAGPSHFAARLSEGGAVEWAEAFESGWVPGTPGGIAEAADGAIFTAGGFGDTLWIGDEAVVNEDAGSFFLAKLREPSSAEWVIQAEPSFAFQSASSRIHGIQLEEDHLYAIGSNGVQLPRAMLGAFVARFSLDGSLYWGVRIRSEDDHGGSPADILPDGEGGAVAAVGLSSSSFVIGDSAFTTDVEGGSWGRLLLARFDDQGDLLWTRVLGGVSWPHYLARAESAFYLAGTYSDSVQLSDATVLPPPETENEAFLARYDMDGGLGWVRTLPASGGSNSIGAATDPEGRLHHLVHFAGTLALPEEALEDGRVGLVGFTPEGAVDYGLPLPGDGMAVEGRSLVTDGQGHLYAWTGNSLLKIELATSSSSASDPDLERAETLDLVLGPVHPNPVEESGLANYHLPINAAVRLSIFDVLGRELRVLVSGNQPPGRHEVTIGADGLPSGAYYLRLQAGQRIRTTSFVVAR